MSRGSIREYTQAIRERYRKAGRKEKGKMLEEFVQVTGYHRKAVIRLLKREHGPPGRQGGRPRVYGPTVAEALKVAWEVTDHLCGKRLKPFLRELVEVLWRHGELTVPEGVSRQLGEISAATIDRLLRPYKSRGKKRPFSTTKPGSLLKGSIPIRTFADWEEGVPGFLEVDPSADSGQALVAHCGESTEGFYLNTLCGVDVATGWVECQEVWGKGQERVGGAVHHLRKRLPFPLLGLDSDNGSEFINHGLYGYCRRNRITFTRALPYKKNDSAHVEQKACP